MTGTLSLWAEVITTYNTMRTVATSLYRGSKLLITQKKILFANLFPFPQMSLRLPPGSGSPVHEV